MPRKKRLGGGHPRQAHRLFLTWMIMAGVVFFMLLVAWNEGLVSQLYASDKSYISLFITLLFFGTTLYCALYIFRVSGQLNAAAEVGEILSGAAPGTLSLDGDRVVIAEAREERGKALPPCLLSSHIGDLLRMVANLRGKALGDTLTTEQRLLMEASCQKFKGGTELGWFIADAMLKLGLLGTVIGFIIMLGSVAGITSFDTSVMQDILARMSNGMGIALYTTLTGLICGALLGLQCHLLDRGTESLAALMTRIVELQAMPRLVTAHQAPGGSARGGGTAAPAKGGRG